MSDRSETDAWIGEASIYEAIVEQMADEAVVVDSEKRLRYANRGALEYTDRPLESIRGRPIIDLVADWARSDADTARFDRALDAVLQDGTKAGSVTLEFDVPTGRVILDCEFSPLRAEETLVGAVIVSRDVTERERRKRDLERTQQLQAVLTENTGVINFEFDGDGTIRRLSGQSLDRLGVEAEDVLGRSVFDLFEDGDQIPALCRQALDGVSIDATIRLGDRVLDTHFEPILADDERVRSVVGLAVDVTGRQRHRDRLAALNWTARRLFEADSEQAVAEVVCPAAAEVIGFDSVRVNRLEDSSNRLVPLAQSAGMDSILTAPQEPYPPDSFPQTVQDSGEPMVVDNTADLDSDIFADDAEYAAISVPIDDNGTFEFFTEPGSVDPEAVELAAILAKSTAAALDDIEHEQELRRERAFVESVVDAVPDVLYAFDETGALVEYNDRMQAVSGYDSGDIEGMRPWEFIPESDRATVRDRFWAVLEDELPQRVETEFLTKDGETIPYEFTGGPLYGPDGEVEGVVGIGRDITERKRHEAELEQFAYAASHDLREPLRVISNYLQLLQQRHGDALDADAVEYLEYATDAADRMQDRLAGLLTYSRVDQDEQLERVDLDEVLEDTLADLTLAIDESGAKISVGNLPTVRGNPEQLRTVFQNLLENALAYAGDAPPVVDVRAQPREGDWLLSVADKGIGMDPTQAERAFDLFERFDSDTEGTGIGLALCEKIVDHHGGSIWIDTNPGDGVAVNFTLPRKQ